MGALACAVTAAISAANDKPQPNSVSSADTSGYVGNQSCGKCHASIYQSYSLTAHAHASGPAGENLVSGEFTHQSSRVKYRVYSESGKVWMSFERPGDPMVEGRRELL